MLNWATVKENLRELLNEFMVYLSQTMVVFLVAVFSSSFLTDKARLKAFIDTSVNVSSMPTLGYVSAALLAWFGVLWIAKKVFGGPVLCRAVREALLEFPRLIYLAGSTFTGVAMAIAIYAGFHPGVVAQPAAWWWWVALVMTLYGFGIGFLLRGLMSSTWLTERLAPENG